MSPLPDDLSDSPRYEQWLADVRGRGLSSSQIISLLAVRGGEVASLRCARIALAADDYGTAREYAAAAWMSSRPEVAVCAKALLAASVVEEARADSGPSEHGGAVAILPALLYALEEVRALTPRTPFTLEAECVVRLSLNFAYQQLNQFERALKEVSEVILTAKSLGLILTERAASVQLTVCLVALGRLSESVPALVEQIRQPVAGQLSLAESRRQLADVLHTLGDTGGAVGLLSELAASTTHGNWPSAYIQLYRLLDGTGGVRELPVGDHPWAGLYGGLVEALRAMVGTMALLPQAQNRAALDQALTRVIRLLEPRDRLEVPWLAATGRWLRSLAFARQGRHGLAAEELRKAPEVYPQWLDIRLVMAGQQIELALQPVESWPDDLRRGESALRSVFGEARALPYASRAGLARRLRFWHPQAAAYAAVMPRPIEELLDAQDSILRVGERNSVYGLTIPPVYAVELTLRSLGLDHRRTFAPARLNKTQTAQRQALFAADAAIPVWRPVVGAPLLILGLHQFGSADHESAARRVARSFGLVPQNKTPYMEAELGQVGQTLTALLEGRISHAQAVKKLNEI